MEVLNIVYPETLTVAQVKQLTETPVEDRVHVIAHHKNEREDNLR